MATRRNLWLAGVLLGLVVLVAVASRAHSPAGGGTTHGIDSNLIWEFVLIGFFALFVLSFPIAVWVVVSTRLDAPPSRKKRRNRVVSLAVGLALFLLVSVIAAERFYGNHDHAKKLTPPAQQQSGAPIKGNRLGKKVPFDWLPAIVILSIAGVGSGVVAYTLFRKPPRLVPTEADLAARLSAVLDDSLDDLRAEKDPRRAVIATYARMEQTLAGAGLPRAESETPLEYLGRVLRELLHTSADAVSRLTALFERAKFSPHEIDGAMKRDAIHALVAVRDELRAAAA
jgi:uncharacterized protein DUF4129